MTEMPAPGAFLHTSPEAARDASGLPDPIGVVLEIGGSSGKVMFEMAALAALTDHPDPLVAVAGQVGSQIKVPVGSNWLIANVRSLKLEKLDAGRIIAEIDFLGEGGEEKLTRKLYHFRRGVTRYPSPGAEVFPVTRIDLRQVYAADDRAHIEVGAVYPTRDIRGRCSSMRCWASISRCSAPPAPANRPPPR